MTTTHVILTSTWKNISYVVMFCASLLYSDLSPMSVNILALFIVLDIATGISCSGLIDGWTSVKSSRLQRGLLAKLLLVMVPALVALTGKGIGLDLTQIAIASLDVLILAEAYSILGNIQSLRNGCRVAESDAISMLLSNLQDLLSHFIKD